MLFEVAEFGSEECLGPFFQQKLPWSGGKKTWCSAEVGTYSWTSTRISVDFWDPISRAITQRLINDLVLVQPQLYATGWNLQQIVESDVQKRQKWTCTSPCYFTYRIEYNYIHHHTSNLWKHNFDFLQTSLEGWFGVRISEPTHG